MNAPGSTDTSRARRVAVAAAGALALGIGIAIIRIDTVASFTDSVWAGGTFNLGEVVDIESSTVVDGPFEDHSSPEGALEFAPGVSLVPGETAYAGLYLRTAGYSSPATVSMSPAGNAPGTPDALWTAYLTYGTRSATVTDPASAMTCDAGIFDEQVGTELAPRGSTLTIEPVGEFSLAPESGSVELVCFEFTLSDDVIDEPALNGATVDPVWTFTGTQAP